MTSSSAAAAAAAVTPVAPSSTYLGTRCTVTRMSEQRTENDREEHLYLLFDDWEFGYSIRKVSLPRRSGSGIEPLPEAFMHVRAPRGYPDLFTSAFGTKIMVMHPEMIDDTVGIPMIDVHEQTLTFGPKPIQFNAVPIFFPVGDNMLFVLDFATFDCYLWTPENNEEPWESQVLSYPPFNREDVSSYGVQPNGCILFSTTNSSSTRTFILDTTKEEYVCKPYGNWVFPFSGRAHYDTSLEGFVGLSSDGYLYCSTMFMAYPGTGLDTDETLHPCPDFKRTKENLYNGRHHVSATLVQMGQGKFCLVESISTDNRRSGQELRTSWAQEFKLPLGAIEWDCVGGGPQGGRVMYRLKTFNLSYDKKGNYLKLTHCKVSCYSLPDEAKIGSVCMDPMAFWL